jgi:CheY-specific phosphatase CheX
VVDAKQAVKKGGLAFIGSSVLVLSVLWYFQWLPFPDFLISPVVFGAVILVLILSVFGYKFYGMQSERIPDFSRKTERQLTDKEAFRLLEYDLTMNRLIRIGEMHERGPEIVGPEDQDDNVRLYKMEFDRKNVSEKVGVVLDLEQEMDVNPGRTASLREAARRIDNIKLVRGKKVDDFDEAMEDAVSSLGRSLDQNITTTKYDDEGNVVEEKSVPASVRRAKQQLPGNNSSEEVEE